MYCEVKLETGLILTKHRSWGYLYTDTHLLMEKGA